MERIHVVSSLPGRYSPLAEHFVQQFPGHDLPSMLSKFSLPVSLAEFRNPLEAPAQEARPLLQFKFKISKTNDGIVEKKIMCLFQKDKYINYLYLNWI